jgi:hypothetical protein
MVKKGKYDEDCVSYGFTCINERVGARKPQCLLCKKILANGSMKPAKLKEHLMSVHPENAPKDFFFLV